MEISRKALIRLSGGFLVFGVVILILGITMSDYVDNYLNEQADEQVTIYPENVNKDRYDYWKSNYDTEEHPPEFQDFYIWEFENVEQIRTNASIKPRVKQHGPYVYQIFWENFDDEFSLNEDFVTFHRFKYYVFRPDLSNGLKEEDQYRVLNIGYLSLYFKAGITVAAQLEQPFRLLSVRQIVFDYTAAAGTLNIPVNLFYNCTTKAACADKFGYRGQYTGVGYKDRVTTLDLWYSDTYLRGVYLGDHKIDGTEKRQFHRNVKKEDILRVWDDDAFRQVELRYERERTVKGIKLFEYHPVPETFLPSQFFLHSGPDGMFNVTSVNIKKYAVGPISGPPVPVYISRPHFLLGDPELRNAVDGLSPNYEKHETFLAIEPFLGTLMDGSRRAQVNVKLEDVFWTTASRYKNLPEIFLPHLWFEERGSISTKLANEFKDQVYFAQDARDGIFLAGVIVGPILIAAGVAVGFYVYRKDHFAERSGHSGNQHHYAQVVTSPY
eukprot:TRINITY_DN831_c0_g1_i1.p1 TRINITY_DN831_c0_g1~~TRINITY_DN831_c0_g1_i1.p1  ORF type:complete len:496 (-),score=118.65 TRINITY_DN831_c0_g1_i1:333-1820(-)